jgi:tRNA A-37 threonylcarbamoyl transferase component Bud32
VSARAGRSLGRYRLEAPLGYGGMAEVYRATDTKLVRTVAVKVILATHAAEEHFVERFLREARMVASLEHPNILPVYDFGEENGVPFLVMPYLPGGSLRERLKAGPAPLAVAAAWIAQLAGALDAAHAAGVLHRDVKPANVLLGKDDRLFLADFGIAKVLENQTGLTATGVMVGTPVYMAPEQAQGHPASRATDRYALAVVAYEILAGRPPFEGESALSLMHQHVSAPPPVLSTRVGGLPAGLDAVLSQALAKDPAARPPTCRALADAVAAFLPAGITPPPGLSGWGTPARSMTGPTILAAPELRPATPPPVRLSGARPGLTSEQTVLTGPRRAARRAAYAGALAAAALAGAWWVVAHRAAPASAPLVAPPAVSSGPATPPSAPMVPAAEPSTFGAAPSSVAVVERTPLPSAPAKKAEPLVKRLADEDKRIADLEARVREGEAAAALAAHAAGSKAPPPPAEPDSSAALDDAAHPLAAARARLEPARRLAHRLSREDFQFALGEAQRVLKEHPRNPDAKYLKMYARGGLAYVAGNDSAASDLLVKSFTELHRAAKREARPIAGLLLRPDGTMGQPNGWELALGYGDARGEAMGLIEKELQANPGSPRARKARTYLRRMQGLAVPARD